MKKITESLMNNKLLEHGYYADSKIIYRLLLGLLKMNRTYVNPAQDIYALCLDGPPGAGKTEYAKVYTKVLKEVYGEDQVSFIGYQCDPTTGKTQLYEDLNIIATVVDKDREKIIIPGVISKAIKEVNSGKKVVLFLDEYDKAREETDSFFLQFLQDGKIDTTQYGTLEIKEEYKNNLQVILCKNDVRKDLSNQFYRRTHMLRLDYMKPELFYQVAQRKMVVDRMNSSDLSSDTELLRSQLETYPKYPIPINEEIINLVSLIYQTAYKDRDAFMKLSSPSEMLIAIEEMNDLVQYTDASQAAIYDILINDLFKYQDDVNTFESQTTKGKDENSVKLKEILSQMKKTEDSSINHGDLDRMIADSIFEGASNTYYQKTAELEGLIEKYDKRFQELERSKKKQLEQGPETITVGDSEFVGVQKEIEAFPIFHDESAYIKRGMSVFSLADNWCDVGSMYVPDLTRSRFLQTLVSNPGNFGITAYEDGFFINQDCGNQLIMVTDQDEEQQPRFRFLSDQFVSSASVLLEIGKLNQLAVDIPTGNVALSKDIQDKLKNNNPVSVHVDTLIYNKNPDINGEYITQVDGFSDLYSAQFMVQNGTDIGGNSIFEQLSSVIAVTDEKRYTELNQKIKANEKVKSKVGKIYDK